VHDVAIKLPHRPLDAERPGASDRPAFTQARSSLPVTTIVERVLLGLVAASLPFDRNFSTVAGIGPVFILFGLIAGYVVLLRSKALICASLHPIFLAGFGSVAVNALLETLHGNASYPMLFRTVAAIGGGILVASLCRDRRAVAAGMYGFASGSALLAVLLLASSYSIVTSRAGFARNYVTAGEVRDKMAESVSVQGDLNALAFFDAVGAAVTFGLGLTTRRRIWSIVLFATAATCAVAAFIPMSRGGVGILGLSMLFVLKERGKKGIATFALLLLLGGVVLAVAPRAVFSRMGHFVSARDRVYSAAVQSLPEYAVTGVGVGNYWAGWAASRGIRSMYGDVGAHNSFLQVWIYWGFLGLFGFLGVVLMMWRYSPAASSDDGLRISVRVLAFALLAYLMVAHTFYDKHFAFGMGLIAGGSRWVWPLQLVRNKA